MDKVKCVVEAGAHLGESPVWDQDRKLVYWIDILERKFYTWDPQSKKLKVMEPTEKITSIALTKSGDLIASVYKGFSLLDPQTGVLTSLVKVEADLPNNRFNDGKCDRAGRFWAGTMDGVHTERPTGTLYALGAGRQVIPSIATKAACLNGPAWSLDNRTIYVTQSFDHTIFAYDFDLKEGTLSNKRVFVSFVSSGGVPDGLTVDSEGCIWSAVGRLGQVVRISPSGKILRTISFPVPGITSCTFGGEALKTVYVTSARENMSLEEIQKYPLSGSLFSFETDVSGVLEPRVSISL